MSVRLPVLAAGSVLMTMLAPGVAFGASSGGAGIPERATVSRATCATGETWACRWTQELTISGTSMDNVKRVVFLGHKGTKDNRTAEPQRLSATELRVTLPRNARSGPLRLEVPAGRSTSTKRRLKILTSRIPQADVTGPAVDLAPGEALIAGSRKRAVLRYSASAPRTVEAVRLADGAVVRTWPVAAGEGELRWDGTVKGAVVEDGHYALRLSGQPGASAANVDDAIVVHDAIFPIRGKHDLGQSATNNFGGARHHGGQDMFAKCGTPLVAVRPGTVQAETYQSRAGNYVVLQDATGQSYTYMHMRDRALVKTGTKVRAGQRLGYVGETGRATGCHLHLELWTAPGWYTGGKAIDPLPELTRWDAFS